MSLKTIKSSIQTVEKFEFVPSTFVAGIYFNSSSNYGTYYIQVPTGKICTLQLLQGYITEGTTFASSQLIFKKNNVNFGSFILPPGSISSPITSTIPTPVQFADGDKITVEVIGNEPSIGIVSFLTIKLI